MLHLPRRLRRTLTSGIDAPRRRRSTKHGAGRHTLVPAFEELELRQLLTAASDTTVDALIGAMSHERDSAPNPIGAPLCVDDGLFMNGMSFSPAVGSRVDLNLDGRFDSSDIVAAYQARLLAVDTSGTTSVAAEENVRTLFQPSDLIRALQSSGYESNSLRVNGSCIGNIREQQFEYDYLDAGDQTTRETVTYTFEADTLRFRSAKNVDLQGDTQVEVVDTYLRGSQSIDSRSERQFDASGRLSSEFVLYYSERGDVRRSATTTYLYDQSPLRKLTNVQDFDDQGKLVFSSVHYFDDHLNQTRLILLTYDDGLPIQDSEDPEDTPIERVRLPQQTELRVFRMSVI